MHRVSMSGGVFSKIKKLVPKKVRLALKPIVRAGVDNITQIDRRLIAHKYLKGDGIEIGALQHPLPMPRGARVRYVDFMGYDELRKEFPELKDYKLTPPDVLDDGERLEKFADASLDFVVANHFIEHCPNPFLALRNLFRVLRPGGVLFMAIPDKRFTFDADRTSTPVEHLIRDYTEGPGWSRRDHYEEWVTVVCRETGEAHDRYLNHLLEVNTRVHFHAWAQADMLEMLHEFSDYMGVAFNIELLLQNGQEVVFVLRRLEIAAGLGKQVQYVEERMPEQR